MKESHNKMQFLNKTISQNLINKLLCLFFVISIIGIYITCIDKVNALPYLILGIGIASLFYLFSPKIRLYSPIFCITVSSLISYIIAPLYYFHEYFNVKKNPAYLFSDIFIEINTIYVLFFISLFFPIIFYLIKFSKQKWKGKSNIFKNVPSSSTKYLNFLFIVVNVVFLLFIISAIIYSGMSFFQVFLLNAKFRNITSNGFFGFVRVIFTFLILLTYVFALKQFFCKNIKISKFNLIFLAINLFLWSFMNGGRSFLIFSVFFTFILMYIFFNKKILLRNILIFALMGLVMLTYSIIQAKYRASSELDYINKNITKKESEGILYSLIERSDAFPNSVEFFKYLKKRYDGIFEYTDYRLGHQILVHYTTLAPKPIRQIISNDPDYFYGFNALLTLKIFPEVFESKVGFDFGLVSNLYYNLGIFAIVIGGFLLGLFTILCEILFKSYINKDSFILLYMLFLYPFFTTVLNIGIINSPNIIAWFITIPLLVIIVCIANLKIKIKLK